MAGSTSTKISRTLKPYTVTARDPVEQMRRALRRAEHALAVEHAFVATTLDAIPSIIVVLDAAGCVVRMNRACEELTGWSQSVAVGRDFIQEVFEPAFQGPALRELRRVAAGFSVGPYESLWHSVSAHDAVPGHASLDRAKLVRPHKVSPTRLVRWTLRPLQEQQSSHGVHYLVLGAQDLSQYERLERMKDEFVSTVSHELRTPLTALRAALGLVESDKLDHRPETRRQMMDMAVHNCERLIHLVNDIVDIDRLDRGRVAFHRERIAVGYLLNRAMHATSDVAARKRVRVALNVGTEPELTVHADEEQILGVLAKLIQNAIRFAPLGSVVTLSAWGVGAYEVCFAVEDQGDGIPQAILATLFEPFQQLDSADARYVGGAGISLALCRLIVEQLGGGIWAESAPGEGTRFLVTLPRMVM